MRRSRSSLEGLIVAWIALQVVSGLLGYGFAFSFSHPSGTALAFGKLFGIASIVLAVAIVVTLIARDEVGVALAVLAILIALPLVLAKEGKSRPSTRTVQARIGALSRTEAIAAVTRIVSTFYGEAGPRPGAAQNHSGAGSIACSETMNAEAQQQLARLFPARNGYRLECGRALEEAVRLGKLGSRQTDAAGIRYSVGVSKDLESAEYEADNGVRFLLAPERPGWRITSFKGGAFLH